MLATRPLVPPPEVQRQEPGLWRLAWRNSAPSRLLIVAETWERGWRAWVDGQPRPVEVVGGLLLGLRVGPGAGQAELRYRPPGLAAGAALSLLALLSLVAALTLGRQDRRRVRLRADGGAPDLLGGGDAG
jgi:hypothetical protein